MQMFLLGKNHKDKNNNNNTITNIYSNRNNNNILSVNKRNTILKHELRMKILNNQHPTLSPINTNTISTHKYLPSINSQFNISPLSQNLSYTSFPKNPKHKSTEPKTSTSTSSQQTFHFHTPTPFLNLKQHSSYNHIKSFPTPQSILSPFKYHKQPKTTRQQHLPTHTHLKPQLTLRERLQNPNITFLHNLHKKLLRKRKKLFETIILPTNITDMYEHNSHLPPSTIAIDSFISFLDVISKIGDFDSAVYEVWNNDGKKFKINKKDLNKITLPVAQLICTAHNKSLPTTEEFTSMAKWLVAQDSDQLASYVLDVFKNTFVKVGQAKSISSNNANGFFIAKERIKRMNAAGKKNEAKLIENIYKPILDFWGIDITEIPDYLPGQQIIAKKYGESFKSAVVGDWADALG